MPAFFQTVACKPQPAGRGISIDQEKKQRREEEKDRDRIRKAMRQFGLKLPHRCGRHIRKAMRQHIRIRAAVLAVTDGDDRRLAGPPFDGDQPELFELSQCSNLGVR